MSSQDDNNNEKTIRELLGDLPVGPLTKYRKQASFDWITLKIAVEDEFCIRYRYKVWSYFQQHEVFHKPTSMITLPLNEQRKLAHRRMRAIYDANFFSLPEVAENYKLSRAYVDMVAMYDIDMSIKFGLNYVMFCNVLRGLGTDRHVDLTFAVNENQATGCFALTEFAHGSNAKGIQTTATHDPENHQFILNCADFKSAKCWAGNLGKCATHAIIYAKLITSDGKHHGLHAFAIPIRCTKTLEPFPGVIVGDLGEKIALNGVDNGFLMFQQYRISVDCLLNKTGDVDKDGNYVNPRKHAGKKFGTSLGTLSQGRVQIGMFATNQLIKAITVAVRYSAVRQQFGPENSEEEYSVIEYQQQQFRLFPYLASIYACKVFSAWLSDELTKFVIDSILSPSEEDHVKALEIHAVSSASKPTISWLARDGIQVCREACGGHGYLKAAGIGDWRNENDANCTYEGENSVLIQQTSNWLIGLWRKVCNGENILTPYGNAEFLNHSDTIPWYIEITSSKDAMNPEVILTAYKWLNCYYLRLITDKINKLSQLGKDTFTIRNDTQSYHAASLSVIFTEYIILYRFHKFACEVEDMNCRTVIIKLVSLYGLWSLEKHLGSLYMGKFLSEDAGQYIRDAVLELCLDIKPEAVALVDTLAPPDFILNSVLGCSDGKVYEKLQTTIFSNPDAMKRPDWWEEVVSSASSTQSKL